MSRVRPAAKARRGQTDEASVPEEIENFFNRSDVGVFHWIDLYNAKTSGVNAPPRAKTSL